MNLNKNPQANGPPKCPKRPHLQEIMPAIIETALARVFFFTA